MLMSSRRKAEQTAQIAELRSVLDAVHRSQAVIEFDLDGVEDPQAEARKMCEQLLANTVIESYRIEAA